MGQEHIVDMDKEDRESMSDYLQRAAGEINYFLSCNHWDDDDPKQDAIQKAEYKALAKVQANMMWFADESLPITLPRLQQAMKQLATHWFQKSPGQDEYDFEYFFQFWKEQLKIEQARQKYAKSEAKTP